MADLFSDSPASNYDSAISLISECLEELGLDPAKAKLDEGRYAIARGSAQIILMVQKANEHVPQGALRVLAPIVHLPEDETQLAKLLKHAMSLNGSGLRGASFGIAQGAIVVLAERALLDLDRSEVDAIIRTVSKVADEHDDEFAERFQARLYP